MKYVKHLFYTVAHGKGHTECPLIIFVITTTLVSICMHALVSIYVKKIWKELSHN